MPVSYTHLDVYKRQGQNAVMLAVAVALLLVPSRVLACLLSRLVPLHDEDPAPETLQKKLLPRALVYGCLLYTSTCSSGSTRRTAPAVCTPGALALA